MKHTPTPWRKGSHPGYIIAGDGDNVFTLANVQTKSCYPSEALDCFAEMEANTEQIIHCVNSYPMLITALRSCRMELVSNDERGPIYKYDFDEGLIQQALACAKEGTL